MYAAQLSSYIHTKLLLKLGGNCTVKISPTFSLFIAELQDIWQLLVRRCLVSTHFTFTDPSVRSSSVWMSCGDSLKKRSCGQDGRLRGIL